VNVFNLGIDGYCVVTDSIGWICEALGVKPSLEFTGGDRGWVGDNPFIFLETAKIRSLGWKPDLGIREGIIKTVQFLRPTSGCWKPEMNVCVQGCGTLNGDRRLPRITG